MAIGGLILLFGLSIIGYFLYKVRSHSTGNAFHIFVHLFEAIALLFTGFIYHQEGKTYIQYVFLAASIGFFIAVVIAVRKIYLKENP